MSSTSESDSMTEKFAFGVAGCLINAPDVGPVVFVGEHHQLARLVAAKLLLQRRAGSGQAQQGFMDSLMQLGQQVGSAAERSN
jgi:hypothetical protein